MKRAELFEAAHKLNMLKKGDHILAAVSGGADSVALLMLLTEYRDANPDMDIRLSAAHLNHMLRGGESDRDERFVAELCNKLSIHLVSGRADIPSLRERGEGTEAAARRVRYDFLLKTAKSLGCTAIATAHNANDQAETVLMALIRGSGGRGLGGIPPVRETDGARIIRPLLYTLRTDIEKYLEEQKQEYVTDSSNLSDEYTRNRLRLEIIPRLEDINPRFVRHAVDTSIQLSGDERFLEGLAGEYVDEEDSRIIISRIASLDRALLGRAIRRLCFLNGVRPQRDHVEAVIGICLGTSPSARIDLPGNMAAVRRYDELYIQPVCEAEPASEAEKKLELGENEFNGYVITVSEGEAAECLILDAAQLGDLAVRTRKAGDSISPAGRGWTKSLKKLFIEMKVPRAERERWPVITCGGNVCAVAGVGVDKSFAPKSPHVISVSVRKG